jgi:hypothetical protein
VFVKVPLFADALVSAKDSRIRVLSKDMPDGARMRTRPDLGEGRPLKGKLEFAGRIVGGTRAPATNLRLYSGPAPSRP